MSDKPRESAIHFLPSVLMKTVLLLSVLLISVCPPVFAKEIPDTENPLDMDRPEYTIGVVTGAGSEKMVKELFHNASFKSYKNPAELILGLEQGQTDCIVYNGTILESALREKPDTLYILEQPVGVDEMCMAVSPQTKIDTLHADLSQFMQEKKESGYLDDLCARWTGGEPYVMPDIPRCDNPRAVITIGTQGTLVPYSFYQGDELIGMCIELVRTFALEYSYGFEYRVEDTTSILADAEFGRIDMTDGAMYYTPERAEQADFIFPAIQQVPTEMMVLSRSRNQSTGFWEEIRLNFEKTMIREDRWKLILSGLQVTVLLTVCSLVLGTLLAFVFTAAKRSRIRLVSGAMSVVIELITGMPIVLFLMICFYIIFRHSGLSEIAVAVIAFAVDFGCRGAVTLNSGIESVQKGEIEAAEAMGMDPLQISRLIIMPQAIQNVFGVYKVSVVSLIKSTSVVGYIAVQDLTKVSDIIRARTYEAFFSLVLTAAIYFLLCRIVLFLLSLAQQHISKGRRTA